MLARDLELFLSALCSEAEMAPVAHDDLEKRFASLRGYGCLPRGRENRARPLTDQQIALAILGLAIVQPGWAGHAATVLARRYPVGARAGAFAGAGNLLQALVRVLADETVRQMLVAVHLSTAEVAVNSHGFATIHYDEDGVRKRTSYIAGEAVSLLQPGAEAGYDPDRCYALFAREVAFNRRFFDRLSERVARERVNPSPLQEDCSEYDAEEAERARQKRLGVMARELATPLWFKGTRLHGAVRRS